MPAIEATTASGGATTLHEPIMARPSLRPHCTMPPGLDVVDFIFCDDNSVLALWNYPLDEVTPNDPSYATVL
jgi:hypothetical protein